MIPAQLQAMQRFVEENINPVTWDLQSTLTAQAPPLDLMRNTTNQP